MKLLLIAPILLQLSQCSTTPVDQFPNQPTTDGQCNVVYDVAKPKGAPDKVPCDSPPSCPNIYSEQCGNYIFIKDAKVDPKDRAGC
jgi:hypothetical protein